MKAAFVVMSILGCDDAAVHCLPVATEARQWRTIAACDAASEKILDTYRHVNYPMVVAVCQTADSTALIDSEAEIAERSLDAKRETPPAPPVGKKEAHPGLTVRAIALMKHALPTGEDLKEALVDKPVHFVTDTYSWVARKISR